MEPNKNPRKIDKDDLRKPVFSGYNLGQPGKVSSIIEKPEFKSEDAKDSHLETYGNPDVSPEFKLNNAPVIKGSTSEGVASIKSMYYLSLIMLKNIDKDKVGSLEEDLLKKDLSSNKMVEFLCKKCGNVKLNFKRTCSHNSCLYCLKNNVKKYLDNLTASNFMSLRCGKCYEIPKDSDIELLFPRPNNTVIKYNNALVIKQCSLCKRKLNLATDYLPELTCLHLCRDCYTDQLYMKIDSCMVCKKSFSNKDLTLVRSCTCTNCGKKNKLVLKAYKCYYEDKIICFPCQTIIVKNMNWQEAFGSNDHKEMYRTMKYYCNKLCPYCEKTITLSEVNPCSKCGNFMCDDCKSSDTSCKYCGSLLGY